MELAEKQYRATKKSNKKYAKRLTVFINTLLDKGHILESHHHFKELSTISPDHIKTILIGYKLSIRMFDSSGVSYYDKRLYELNCNEETLLRLRLQYYNSVNDKASAEDCAILLLSKKHIKLETLRDISDFAKHHESYDFISSFGKYLKLNQMTFHPSIEKQFKQFVIYKLLVVLRKAKT